MNTFAIIISTPAYYTGIGAGVFFIVLIICAGLWGRK